MKSVIMTLGVLVATSASAATLNCRFQESITEAGFTRDNSQDVQIDMDQPNPGTTRSVMINSVYIPGTQLEVVLMMLPNAKPFPTSRHIGFVLRQSDLKVRGGAGLWNFSRDWNDGKSYFAGAFCHLGS
jgi:hypothetical protein